MDQSFHRSGRRDKVSAEQEQAPGLNFIPDSQLAFNRF
jgi:hypothetical protein